MNVSNTGPKCRAFTPHPSWSLRTPVCLIREGYRLIKSATRWKSHSNKSVFLWFLAHPKRSATTGDKRRGKGEDHGGSISLLIRF